MFKRYLPPAHIVALLAVLAIVALIAPENLALAKGLSAVAFTGAVVNVKSTAVLNLDREYSSGLPITMNTAVLSHGKEKVDRALVTFTAGESNNSTYRFARVPSNAVIDAVEVCAMDAIAGLTAMNIGVYDTAQNGGAVVSTSLFATALDLHTGLTAPVDYRWTNLGAAGAEQALWQLLGLASDPGKDYDLVLTATTRGANGGKAAMRVRRVNLTN